MFFPKQLRSLAAFIGMIAVHCSPAPVPVQGQSLVRFPVDSFPIPADNQPTAQRIELGRLLFFDPVLSKNQRVACASCHLPERAMSDGLHVGAALSDPAGGDLPRASPTIFNVRYQHVQFWDGRATSLEDLALLPIQNPREMGNTIPFVLNTLRAIPEYLDLFAAAYPPDDDQAADAIDATSLRRAIASFLRTVTADNTPADRYLDGDAQALSPDAEAGFNLYFGKARCSRCHYVPLFAGTEGPSFVSTEFRISGVPERGQLQLTADLGNGAISNNPLLLHAFKAPTLRNIAATAPYMHNGAFDTLEQVVDFYDTIGDPARGYDVPNLDRVLASGPLRLTFEEKRQLVSFLREGLTDLSGLPTRPATVPSGLGVGGFPRDK